MVEPFTEAPLVMRKFVHALAAGPFRDAARRIAIEDAKSFFIKYEFIIFICLTGIAKVITYSENQSTRHILSEVVQDGFYIPYSFRISHPP